MNDNIPQNAELARDEILKAFEFMQKFLYNLPDYPEYAYNFDRSDLLQIQQAAERTEDRLQQALRYLSRMTGRRYP